MLERTCKHEKHIPNGVRGESVVYKGSVLLIRVPLIKSRYARRWKAMRS